MHMCLPYAMRYVIEAVWFCRYLAVLHVFIQERERGGNTTTTNNIRNIRNIPRYL